MSEKPQTSPEPKTKNPPRQLPAVTELTVTPEIMRTMGQQHGASLKKASDLERENKDLLERIELAESELSTLKGEGVGDPRIKLLEDEIRDLRNQIEQKVEDPQDPTKEQTPEPKYTFPFSLYRK